MDATSRRVDAAPWPRLVWARGRLAAEDGFGLIELMAALVVLTIALLALAAGYDEAFLSLHRSSQKTVAAQLANQQLELYRALPYASIGLDEATLAAVTSSDSTYAADHASIGAADPVGTADTTIAGCGTAPNCLPIRTVVGSDHRDYRIETFIRDAPETVTGVSWSERLITVIVQDADTAGLPELLRLTTGFDRDAG